MVKRIVIEVSGINPELRPLRGCREKHEADAKKAYQKLWPSLAQIGKQETGPNEDEGWKIAKNGDEKIPSDKYDDQDVRGERHKRNSVYQGLRSMGKLKGRADVNSR
jgi:hypothetical protein